MRLRGHLCIEIHDVRKDDISKIVLQFENKVFFIHKNVIKFLGKVPKICLAGIGKVDFKKRACYDTEKPISLICEVRGSIFFDKSAEKCFRIVENWRVSAFC